MNDTLLGLKVNTKLGMDHLVSTVDIGVQCSDGYVVLSGNVDNYAQRTHADTLVQSIEGVSGVDNQLTVGAEAPITKHPFAGPQPLTEEEQEELLYRINNEIANKLRIAMDKVEVRLEPAGVVVLDGEIQSSLFKKTLEDVIWPIAGVAWIVNRLQVDGEGHEGAANDDSNVDDRLSSAVAGARLNARLIARGLVKQALAVKTEVDGEQITIFGDVDNWQLKNQILELAEDVFEQDVTDDITVAEQRDLERELETADAHKMPAGTVYHQTLPPHHQVWHLTATALKETNEDLERRINDHFGSRGGDVQAKVDTLGTAYLAGTVPNHEDIIEAEKLVSETRGVQHVVNGLRVE